MKQLRLICIFLLSVYCSFAQTDSSHIRISLLTCGPGDEMYSIFGHSAIRITDSTNGTDLVANWGTFDFDDPDFYAKFVKGTLDYSLSVYGFAEFMYEYQVTQRDVTEQELQLTAAEKSAIVNAIRTNLAGNNRYYKYVFLYDNCTSRIRDILMRHAQFRVTEPLVPAGTSFRDMLHEYLDRGHWGWTKLGMDLLMGSPVDKRVSTTESMFLPDYLMKAVDSNSILAKKQVLLQTGKNQSAGSSNWPLYILSVAAILVFLLSFSQHKTAQSLTRFFDFLLLFLTGAIGCLLLYTWFGTNHGSFKLNHNILWALPTNLVASLFVWNTTRFKRYFILAGVVYGLLLIVWYWLPQQMNPALIPVVILLFLRMVKIARK